MVARRLGPESLVVELASNDGYLLQHFLARASRSWASSRRPTSPRRRERGHPDPGRVLRVDAGHGRREGSPGRPIAANNVFAHVPDLNDFTAGIATLLRPSGVLTIEVAHLRG